MLDPLPVENKGVIAKNGIFGLVYLYCKYSARHPARYPPTCIAFTFKIFTHDLVSDYTDTHATSLDSRRFYFVALNAIKAL